ncbi:MAG TPA: hypothetical protein VMQ56_16400 [Terracidiphilus sp.]|jgi:hypothetical protein|nr:hypothetical protein [Terracidiphilus sp.]
MCYIHAMILNSLAVFAIFLALAPGPLSAQTTTPQTTAAQPRTPVARPQTPATRPQASSPYPEPATVPAKPDCNGIPCEDQQPRTIFVPSAPAPTVWPIHDKILWGVYLVLAFVAYAGVFILRKIERNTRAIEAMAGAAQETASAALETAQSALLHAQSIVNAERPWVLVTAEPARGGDGSFEITATNRGRTPATVTLALDQVVFAADEAHLPGVPEFKPVESGARFVPVILLPGEAAILKTVRREDAEALCGSDEKFASIESWEERLYLCGKVTYADLIAPSGKEAHETNWCCWYIHGKQRSALVPAGGDEYNAHT